MRTLPLIIAVVALALLIAPALADRTVSIGQDYTESSGMVVHLDRVVISDLPNGNVFSPDPANTVWPDLYFTYENKGTNAVNGRLEIAFFDDKGNQYPAKDHITDITMYPISPGNSSTARLVEAAVIPKDTKITSFKIYEGTGEKTYDLAGGQVTAATPTPAAGAATESSAATPGICGLAAVLPLIIVGTVVVARRKR